MANPEENCMRSITLGLTAIAFTGSVGALTKRELPTGDSSNTVHTENLEPFAADLKAASIDKLAVSACRRYTRPASI